MDIYLAPQMLNKYLLTENITISITTHGFKTRFCGVSLEMKKTKQN